MAVDKVYTLTMSGKTWALDCPKVSHAGSATIQPNTYNTFGKVEGLLSITKGEEKPDVINIYIIRFTAGDNFQMELNNWSVKWVDNRPPSFILDNDYEITIIDNLATFITG